MLEIYPWQSQAWQKILAAVNQGRLAHALLVTGRAGMGKRHFADCLASVLLCENSSGQESACGNCRSCILLRAGNHPDLKYLEPEEDATQIKVEQVRDLVDFINLSSHGGRYKVVIIDPADVMNRSATNSLLKTLEEPPPGSVLLLICHQPSLLPITIRSRCQRINITNNDPGESYRWLESSLEAEYEPANIRELMKITANAPLRVIAMLENNALETKAALLADLDGLSMQRLDPVKTAVKWQGLGILEVLDCLLSVFHDMTRLKLVRDSARRNNSNINRQLQHLSNGLDLAKLVACYDLLLEHYHALSGPFNLNKQGLLEDFIIFWQATTEASRG